MERIELLTTNGEHVAWVEIPTSTFPPIVVVWGTRMFLRERYARKNQWAEVFTVVSLTPSPGLPPPEPLPPPPPVDRTAITTLQGASVEEVREQQRQSRGGQYPDYIVLTPEERAKGFVRPVRRSYRHLKCKTVTQMGAALAETYARDPKFYGATFCCACSGHFPVGPDGEFVWVDAPEEKVGT